MDQLSALGVARAEFDRRLRQVEVADWDRPTPCADWNVRDLVLHVLGGLAMIPALLNGCTREEAEAILQGATVPEDFVSEFNRLADAQAEEPDLHYFAGLTRNTVCDPSSAMSRLPSFATATPAGRPQTRGLSVPVQKPLAKTL